MQVSIEALRLGHIAYPDTIFESRQMHFICGPSGCGKSTLLRLLNKTLDPTSGKIRLQGQDIEELEVLQLRRWVQLVGQDVFLFPGSIQDNFAQYYGAREQPVPPESFMEQFLHMCMSRQSLSAQCETLSGGERQRVYLAIQLSFLPKVLLLDEPTSALDPKTAELLMRNIKTLTQTHAMTQIIVSHDPALVHEFSDTQLHLQAGIVE